MNSGRTCPVLGLEPPGAVGLGESEVVVVEFVVVAGAMFLKEDDTDSPFCYRYISRFLVGFPFFVDSLDFEEGREYESS